VRENVNRLGKVAMFLRSIKNRNLWIMLAVDVLLV
jgi:hypothetical protein